MFSKKKKEKDIGGISELRKDVVSGEWVLVAVGRAKRPYQYAKRNRVESQPVSSCPFEDVRINNKDPLLWYPHPDSTIKDNLKEWFVQVIHNKYPAVAPHKDRTCAVLSEVGGYKWMDGVGYHEVIVTRPHEQSLGQLKKEEVAFVVRSYRERYVALKKDSCIAYILVFHNHGKEAGASISHPHSQLIALPIIPPDVERSFRGSAEFFEKHGACIHCRMISWELDDGSRIVYKNEDFVVLAPYASRTSFELRVYPRVHDPHFELMPEKQLETFADAFSVALQKLHDALDDPAYNFFIHTTPANEHNGKHYHWHVEILPKLSIPAGLELGTGIDVVIVAPEEVPKLLSK